MTGEPRDEKERGTSDLVDRGWPDSAEMWANLCEAAALSEECEVLSSAIRTPHKGSRGDDSGKGGPCGLDG